MKSVGSSKKDIVQDTCFAMAEAVVAGAFGVKLKDMRTRTRKHRAQEARQVAIYLARIVFDVGLRELAREAGRSPGTAAHACKQVERRRDAPDFDRSVEFLERQLRSLAGARP